MTRALVGAAVLSFVWLACSPVSSRAATAGGTCTTENAGACETPTRLLVCQSGQWVTSSDCKGPDGCTADETSVECDFRGNSIGDLCAATSEGKVRCDGDGGTSILRCTGGVLNLEFACPGATQCALTDAGLTCR